MKELAIARTPSACDAPLSIGQILAYGVAKAPAQEIVYADRPPPHLHDARRTRAPPRVRAHRAGRRARLHRRGDGLGQPPLSRMLLRGADDGRGAAHGERAHLAGAGALHDQSRRRRRDPRQRRIPAAARADSRQDPAGREVRADQRRTGARRRARSRSPPSTSRCSRGANPSFAFPELDEDTRATTFYTTGTTGSAQGRLLQPSPARAAHDGGGAGPRARAARDVHGAATSTCRSRRCSTSTPGGCRMSPRCSA